MYPILLKNTDNGKTLVVRLVIVPRQHDLINIENEPGFTDGYDMVRVDNVVLHTNGHIIIVIVSRILNKKQ